MQSSPSGSQEELGLTGSAIKEERQPHKGPRGAGGGGGGRGGGGGERRNGPQHAVVNVKNLLNNAIVDGSTGIDNVRSSVLFKMH